MGALSTYLSRTRRLLHDATAKFYSDQDLTDYINQARERVARDTGCLRANQTGIALVAGQETYDIATFLPQGANTVAVLGINVYWGASRVALSYMPWTRFNAQLRYWQNYTGRPGAWSRYGTATIYLGPNPDQNYTSDWDTLITPQPLVTDADTETIQLPYQIPVQYYAAHLAKAYEQSYNEAQGFFDQYQMQIGNAQGSYMPRTVKDPYAV